jgi:hypothetical protein
MGLFGNSKTDKLKNELKESKRRIKELEDLCEEKDSFFKELMADGLKHKSSLAAKHMSDRKKYLNGK